MYIHVKVLPSAKRESLIEAKPNHFVVSVKEPAERNMANKKVIEIISKHFSTKKVRIINGQNSPSKLLSVGD